MKAVAVCFLSASMFYYGYGKESVGTILLTAALFIMVLAMGEDE
jgi:hypothetical protein